MTRRARRWALVGGLVALALVVAGPRGGTSSRPPIRFDLDRALQPRVEPQAASRFFYDGGALRPPVAGTVARGELVDDSAFWTGREPGAGFVAKAPVPVDAALLARGHRRFDIYCATCHDKKGDGKGILFERAQVRTPTFHQDRLRQAPDGYLFAIVTLGFGLMPSYAYQVPVADRWAIIAYLRELQAQRLAQGVESAGAPPP